MMSITDIYQLQKWLVKHLAIIGLVKHLAIIGLVKHLGIIDCICLLFYILTY